MVNIHQVFDNAHSLIEYSEYHRTRPLKHPVFTRPEKHAYKNVISCLCFVNFLLVFCQFHAHEFLQVQAPVFGLLYGGVRITVNAVFETIIELVYFKSH